MKTLIALTGGIGVGKSYIADFFSTMEIPVYTADSEAKKFYSLAEVKILIFKRFGEKVFSGDKIDIKKLAASVFDKEDELRFVNSIIHPLVMQDFIEWSDRQTGQFVIMESAIVFEAALESYFHFIITVNASLETRVKRLQNRYQNSEQKEIEKRIASQMDQNIKCTLSDLIIENDMTNNKDITYKIVRKRKD